MASCAELAVLSTPAVGSAAEPADLKWHTNTLLGPGSPLHSELAEWASHFNWVPCRAMSGSQQRALQ